MKNQNGSSFEHYGVKGMKWGVRRTPEQLGHKSSLTTKGKTEVTFRLTKKKHFSIKVPQVKNEKIQKVINVGAEVLEPYMSPGGIAFAALLGLIPGVGIGSIAAGQAAYITMRDNGQLKKKSGDKVTHSDSFEHYGVLGMKWGVRRTPEQLGHKPTKYKCTK